jgi:uncharacterized protein YbjT (DUF2867 family)
VILVVGGTGDLGGRVVRLLRSRDEDVRCLVRAHSADAALREVGATVVAGDLVDRDSLRAACQDAGVVVATATAIGRQLAGMRRPTMREVDEIGMGHLVDAAEAAGVRRFVYVSFAGADTALGTALERAKLAIEDRLSVSPMTATIVRPDAFQDIHLAPIGRFDIAAGKAAILGKGDTQRRPVSTEDVAALIVNVALDRAPPAVIEFGGPELITRNEAVALAERLTGRTFKRQRMPRPVARLGIRVLGRRNPALASVFGAGLLQDLRPADWDDAPLRERGIVPRSATDYITQQARLADGGP